MGQWGGNLETVVCALSETSQSLCSDLRTMTHGATPQPLPHVFLMWLSVWGGAARPGGAASYFQPSGRMSDGRKYGMKEAARAMPNQPPGTLFTAAMKPVLTWGQS